MLIVDLVDDSSVDSLTQAIRDSFIENEQAASFNVIDALFGIAQSINRLAAAIEEKGDKS
jgi:hypothetical protein